MIHISGPLIIASHNEGKVREFQSLFAPYGIEVRGAAELALPSPEECGETFAQNALEKAKRAAHATGCAALADDSGLCIAALDGAPGIHSARYAQESRLQDWGSLQSSLRKEVPIRVLSHLEETGYWPAMARIEEALRLKKQGRKAYFVAALALVLNDPAMPPLEVEGRVEGHLVWPPRGTQGFGYDAMFQPEGHVRSFGEMSEAEKHGMPQNGARALSHRARAFQTLCKESYV